MANVRFVVRSEFDAAPRVVWDALVDWKGHEAWIPATRVDVPTDDPTAIGAEFTAYTGFGPLALEDRMRVTRCDWNHADDSGACDVDKLGPILRGTAGFTVGPNDDGAVVDWLENVTVPYIPQFLAPVLAWLGAAGFRFGMRRLDKQLAAAAAPA